MDDDTQFYIVETNDEIFLTRRYIDTYEDEDSRDDYVLLESYFDVEDNYWIYSTKSNIKDNTMIKITKLPSMSLADAKVELKKRKGNAFKKNFA